MKYKPKNKNMNTKQTLTYIIILLVYFISIFATNYFGFEGIHIGFIIGWFGMFFINHFEDKE